jgi:thiamine biosynthesis lipoprotein
MLVAGLAVALGGLSAGLHSRADEAVLHRFEFAERRMGTSFQITLFASDGPSATNAATAAFARVADLERVLSDYRDDSELVRLFKAPAGTPHRISADLFDVLERAQHFARLTDGAFDVTAGPAVQLWRRARRQQELPAPEAVEAARRAVGHEKLTLEVRNRTARLAMDGMRLDVGGIAKGYAAEQALAVLRQHDLRRAMVAASGDIAIGDPPPGREGWTIGVASIDVAGSDLTRALVLRNRAISTSGDTHQFVEIGGIRYSHIVDPRTGMGLTNRIGVTVVAADATATDALATAVSVMGVQRGLELIERLPGTAALIVELDGAGGKTLVESMQFSKIPRAPHVPTQSTALQP